MKNEFLGIRTAAILLLASVLVGCYPRGGQELKAAQVNTRDKTLASVLTPCLKTEDGKGGCGETEFAAFPRYTFGFVSGKRGKKWPDVIESYTLRYVCSDFKDSYHCAPWMYPDGPLTIEQPQLRDIEINPPRAGFFPEVEHITHSFYPVPGSRAVRDIPDRSPSLEIRGMQWVGGAPSLGDGSRGAPSRDYFKAQSTSYPLRYATCDLTVDPFICSFRVAIPKSEDAVFESNGVVYDHYSYSLRLRFFPENIEYSEQNIYVVSHLLCEYLSCDLDGFTANFELQIDLEN